MKKEIIGSARARRSDEKTKRTKERFSRPAMPSVARYRTDQLYQRLRLYANGRRLISIMSINLLLFFSPKMADISGPVRQREQDRRRVRARVLRPPTRRNRRGHKKRARTRVERVQQKRQNNFTKLGKIELPRSTT